MLNQDEIDGINAIIASAANVGKASAEEQEAVRTFLLEKAEIRKANAAVGTDNYSNAVLPASVARVADGSVSVRVRGFRKSGLGMLFGVAFPGE